MGKIQESCLENPLLCVKRLPIDWYDTYRYDPVLLETYVDIDRFSGTCYRAANWRYVGSTEGRGKLDTFRERKSSIKAIYLYPLCADYQNILLGKHRSKQG